MNTRCCPLHISGGGYLESRDCFGLRDIGSKDICEREYLVNKSVDGIRVHEGAAILGNHHGVDHDMQRPVLPEFVLYSFHAAGVRQHAHLHGIHPDIFKDCVDLFFDQFGGDVLHVL